MKRLLLLALTPLALTGCQPATELPILPNPAVEKMTGQEFYLSSIEFADGNITVPDKNDFTFTLESESTLVGHIVCNAFRAEVFWDNSNTLTIKSLNKTNNRCLKPDPIALEDKLKYKFSDRLITLQANSNFWRATFARKTE